MSVRLQVLGALGLLGFVVFVYQLLVVHDPVMAMLLNGAVR